ncbi:MAG: hypothetical protein ABI885_20020, partial [Gammaproteobacteria bacterium]
MTLRARRVFLGWIRDRYGFAAAAGHVGRFRRDGTALLAVRNAPPVVVRPGTADLHVFDEVFGQNGYGFDLASSPSVIVDAGAHIGLTAAHFAARYPSAAILALEPEAGNFAVLEQQSNYHPRIIPVRAGLWWRTA